MELSGLISSASVSAAGIAISTFWQGLLLAAFAWFCLKLTPRLSAGARFVIWSVVFVANILLPVLSLARHAGAKVATSGAAPHLHPVQLDSRWAVSIAIVWLLLATARAIGLLRSALRVRALYRTATESEVNASLQPLLRGASSPRTIAIYTSNQVDQPCVIGFLRPRILAPDWLLAKATPAELRQIVLHEASHLRRWDDWTNLLQKFALVAFPLSPALWWIERQLCITREEACDERVVRETQSPREYAVCLTNLAAERMARRTGAVALSLGAWEHRSALARRIHMILRSHSLLSPATARAILTALVMATVGGAVELSTTSPFVTFAAAEPSREIAGQFQAHPGYGTFPASAYHDVVFRQPNAAQSATGPQVIAANAVSTVSRKAKTEANRQLPGIVKKPGSPNQPSFRRASLSADQPHSWILVTRWESSSDQQSAVTVVPSVIVVQRFVRYSTSADSSAPNGEATVQTRSGWFVFQL